jgi:hypothetical protein
MRVCIRLRVEQVIETLSSVPFVDFAEMKILARHHALLNPYEITNPAKDRFDISSQ